MAAQPDLVFDLEQVRAALERLRDTPVSTIQIIKAVTGNDYYSDIGMSASESSNARFGRMLSEHDERLGITNVGKNRSVLDDGGHPTTTAFWRLRR